MKIYIASSWRNQHAVEMLTDQLRNHDYEVLSFVENNYGEGHGGQKPFHFDEWVKTDQADKSFKYDTKAATESDLVIYISPSGTDAWAEVGAAWASGRIILGLYAKGEPAGLMQKMMNAWYTDYKTLLLAVDNIFWNNFSINRHYEKEVREDLARQADFYGMESLTESAQAFLDEKISFQQYLEEQ